jgi:hypothetical protein
MRLTNEQTYDSWRAGWKRGSWEATADHEREKKGNLMPTRKPKIWKGDKWKNPYLMNWPPERGPMPPWMRREPKLFVPTPGRKDGPPLPPPRKPTKEEVAAARARQASIQAEREKIEANFKKNPPKRVKRPAKSKEHVVPGAWRTNIHVATLAKLSLLDAERLVHLSVEETSPRPNRPKSRAAWKKSAYRKWQMSQPRFPTESPVRVTLSYPLRRHVEITVKPYSCRRSGERKAMGEAYVLWTLAREYVRIYRQHKRYRVWGHAITDLWFEGLTVIKKQGDVWLAEVDIGS